MKHEHHLALSILVAIALALAAVVSCLAILMMAGVVTRGLSGIYGLGTVLLCCTVVLAMILEGKL